MEGTEYELLLNRVYGARPEAKGIDADMYREMIAEYQNMITKRRYDSQDERITEFKRAFFVVRECVQAAITDGTKKILMSVKSMDLKELESMALRLEHDFFDRFELYQMIQRANALFVSYGLGAGLSNMRIPATATAANFPSYRN